MWSRKTNAVRLCISIPSAWNAVRTLEMVNVHTNAGRTMNESNRKTMPKPSDEYCRTWAYLLCIFLLIPTSLIKIANSSSSLGLVTIHIIFVSCLAFYVHIADDVNKIIPFVVGVLATSLARALLGLIRQSPSCHLQLSILKNIIHIGLNVVLKQWTCIEFQPNGQFPFVNNFERTINYPATRAG